MRNVRLGRAAFEALAQCGLLMVAINILETAGLSMLHVSSFVGIFRSAAELGIAFAVMFIAALFITNLAFASRLEGKNTTIRAHGLNALLESILFFAIFFAFAYLFGLTNFIVLGIEGSVSFIITSFLVLFLTNLAYALWVSRETRESHITFFTLKQRSPSHDYIKVPRKKILVLLYSGIVCVIVALIILIEQQITWGYWWSWSDFTHHENFAAIIITAGIGLITISLLSLWRGKVK